MRRTKIVCTIGPASRSPQVIERLIRAGMDVARLNFSHGTHQEHAEVIEIIRQKSKKLGMPVAILQDLQGPRIRIGRVKEGSIHLRKGAKFVITTREIQGTEAIVSTTYKGLAQDVRPGDRILLDDGMIQLKVVDTDEVDITCEVMEEGILTDHKGINLPGVSISEPSVTEKDKTDLLFGIKHGVDYVAISFVRYPEDISQVKGIIQNKDVDIPVIAKLEKPEAIEKLEGIMKKSDGVMVARGDLGVELPPEKVPSIQKRIISLGLEMGVPVITATQMLESMREHPRPTRAEVSDVANAIFDGTDAVMLSAETAIGAYPIHSARMMVRIVQEAESSLAFRSPAKERQKRRTLSIPDAISNSACRAAEELKARAIVAFTQSGFTARLISKYRPNTPIIAFTPHSHVWKRLCLYWGVTPKTMKLIGNTDELIKRVEQALIEDKMAHKGDVIVILSGAPIAAKGTTNLMKLHRVGNLI